MLDKLELREFSPPADSPLVISLVEYLKAKGFTVEMSFSHWDFLVYEHSDDPIMVIKTIKNRVGDDTISRLMLESTPVKVILVEGDNPDYKNLSLRRIFLASTGTGVFIRKVGWVSFPSGAVNPETPDLRLKLAKRWTQGKDGTWRKKCTTCGRFLGTEDFYQSAYPTAKDPYRNVCKDCQKFTSKLQQAAKKGRKHAA